MEQKDQVAKALTWADVSTRKKVEKQGQGNRSKSRVKFIDVKKKCI